jgi:hypothetical protein
LEDIVWLLGAISDKYDMNGMHNVETHNIISSFAVHAVNGGWDTVNSRAITSHCPLSIFSYFFRFISILLTLKKLGDDFDGCLAKKAPFFVETILCLY